MQWSGMCCVMLAAVPLLEQSLCHLRRGCLSNLLVSKRIYKILVFAHRFRLHSASLAHGVQQMLGVPLTLDSSFLHEKRQHPFHKKRAVNRGGSSGYIFVVVKPSCSPQLAPISEHC